MPWVWPHKDQKKKNSASSFIQCWDEVALPAEYCRKVEPESVCDLPVPHCTPGCSILTKGAAARGRSRQWGQTVGSALARMTRVLSGQIMLQEEKIVFTKWRKKHPFWNLGGVGEESQIWDSADLERWGWFREQLQVDKAKSDILKATCKCEDTGFLLYLSEQHGTGLFARNKTITDVPFQEPDNPNICCW